MIRRLLTVGFALALALGAQASTALMSGSIDFDNASLWGKVVRYGLGDDGTYAGATSWYTEHDDSPAKIVKRSGAVTGYLSFDTTGVVNRTIQSLENPAGPVPAKGQKISSSGVYFDSEVLFEAYGAFEPVRTSLEDKMTCWIWRGKGLQTNQFVVTAGAWRGSTLVVTNYATTTVGLDMNVSHRLTAHVYARSEGGIETVGFEVYVDNVKVQCADGRDFFPSMFQGADSASEWCVYSMGFTGAGTAEMINFTSANPVENPYYDREDLSMLRQEVGFTLTGYSEDGAGLADFPVLIRIAEEGSGLPTAINGFRYSDAASDGSDIRFTDANGKAAPCEIDVWNPAGESRIWVKVPFLQHKVTLTMHWDLKSGYGSPANDTRKVWSDYLAVWHLNATASGGVLKDSTGNGFTASADGAGITLMPVAEAPTGAGTYVSGTDTNASLLAARGYETLATDGNFTFSGWFAASDWNTGATPPLSGTKYETGAELPVSDEKGWCMALADENTLACYASGAATRYTATQGTSLVNSWHHFALAVTGNATASIYLDAQRKQSGVAFEIKPTERSFQLLRQGMCGDELRLSAKVRTAEWLAAEYDQFTNLTYATAGNGVTKDGYNYWLEEPRVTPTTWMPSEAEGGGVPVISSGKPRWGIVVVKYYDMAGQELPSLPATELGTYRIVFTGTDGLHDALVKEFSVVVYSPRAYSKLDGYDRIMLFNTDTDSASPVALQGYYDVDNAENWVWDHEDAPWQGSGHFVQEGIHHTYYEPETHRVLWTFRHARIGNLFGGIEEGELVAGVNHLPWSATARQYDDTEMPAIYNAHAGCLLLQNVSTKSNSTDPACACSAVYESGIGTIYFDTVNAYAGYENHLAVQVLKSGESKWQTVAVDVFALVNGAADDTLSQTNVTDITLAMNRGGGRVDCFYRVRATVDITASAQFRIVRTDTQEAGGWGTGGDDGEGLIAIDNIVVSPPAMGVKLAQFGAPAEPGNYALRGQRAPFDVAFPTTNDLGTVRGAVRVDRIVNGTNEVDGAFIGSLTMRYRWRYLNQAVGDWQDVLMQPDADDITRYRTITPLEGEGLGDLEYSFQTVVNAPYYDYHDYSGLTGWVWPDGYSERRGNVALSAQDEGLYGPGNESPALGTDYFVRLREGRSPYERIRIHVKRLDQPKASPSVVEMRVSGDNTWRGYYRTKEACAAGVAYHFEVLNRQDEGACAYNWSTNYWCGTDLTKLSTPDYAKDCTTNDWATIPCDAVTGYIMFQLDDSTRGLTIIHADYQNFNAWTDANKSDGDINGHFVGTSTEDDAKSGVSSETMSFEDDFAKYTPTVSTNSLWEEHFYVAGAGGVSTTGRWAINVYNKGKKSTPNGWTAYNTMFVSQDYEELGGDSMALQLVGSKDGSVSFEKESGGPRGLEYFAYRARTAQSYDIFSFNYWLGNDTYYTLQNATFATACSMTTTGQEFQGVGTVSTVGYYKDDTGCYEARVERTAANDIRFSLYKWVRNLNAVKPTLLGSQTLTNLYSYTGLNGANDKYATLVISCETLDDRTHVVAGLGVAPLSPSTMSLSGRAYYRIAYDDQADNRLKSGAFGMSSRDCPALMLRPMFSPTPIDWTQAGATQSGDFYSWGVKSSTLYFPDDEQLITSESDYDSWIIRTERLPKKGLEDVPMDIYGFKAKAPEQDMLVKITSGGTVETVATNRVNSFFFQSFTNCLYRCGSMASIGLEFAESENGPDIVVDDLVLAQWQGLSYDTSGNPDSGLFVNISSGAPSNFVYTAGWIDAQSDVELTPMRTTESEPQSVRSPLMDGGRGRGTGLGMFAFSYRDADARARLLVQIATNGVSVSDLSGDTKSFTGWTTVATYDFASKSEADRASGIVTCYIGLHGITGVMRVVVDPQTVKNARDPAINTTNDPSFGRVVITAVSCRDNPLLDSSSWWGWNLRTVGANDESKWLLEDATHTEPDQAGLSCGLNNSITDDVRADQLDFYPQHKPFVQTPIFTNGVIGEVRFKARKYLPGDPTPTVALYATMRTEGTSSEQDFTLVDEVIVSSLRYETYTLKAPIGTRYTGFRLAVTGVEGVEEPGPKPAAGYVERVLIDEVACFEAIEARMCFRNTGAFRHHLSDLTRLPDLPTVDEQPLAKEQWGIQTEIYASILSEKIDYDRTPQVILHWFKGISPWGYTRWMDYDAAHHVELSPADGNPLVYRSTNIGAEPSVIDECEANEVVQYMLEVRYYMKGESTQFTNLLQSAEWEEPEWFSPVDYNARYGNGGQYFAAFNILDNVAPGWAWLNEVNVFGVRDSNYRNTDETNQYIEVASPAEASLKGWKVNLIIPEMSSSAVITNLLATFGSELAAQKDSKWMQSNMVFNVIASPKTVAAGALTKENGKLDGPWRYPSTPSTTFGSDAVIQYYQPMGVQLVRASGIVEHELVFIGTNFYANRGPAYAHYNPTNTVAFLNRTMPNADFFYAGSDDAGRGKSLGVFMSAGEISNYWNNIMIETPGNVNQFQQIDPDHPQPLGSSILVYATLDNDYGHIRQTCGVGVETTDAQILVVPIGSAAGTNITYIVDPWYELASVDVTEGGPVWSYTPSVRTQVVTVAKNCSNTVTVLARAQVDKRIRDLGCDENNRYTPAILDWLSHRSFLKDVYGKGLSWPDSNGEVYLANFMGLNREIITNMTLTQMYWLDICPTISNQCLIAGMVKPPMPDLSRPAGLDYEGEGWVTNIDMTVLMMITNCTDRIISPYYGKAWAPYVIRGLDPGSTSWDYDSSVDWGWTNATFKIRGILANGLTSEALADNWVPLRYFVFKDGSFDVDFTTRVSVPDPKSPRSLGYSAWKDWLSVHPDTPVFFSWAIDTGLRPVTVEVLQPDNP